MNEDALLHYLTSTFEDVQIQTVQGDHYIFYQTERHFPFATLVTSDAHDTVSDLNRPGIFRLNIGLSRETFHSVFETDTNDEDYTVLDRLMPHPVYGKMHWVCVLNPGPASVETVKTLLAEAYERAATKGS